MSVVLEVRNLKRSVGDRVIITNVSFTVREADVLFVRGPSGVGKTLLLRALAHLDPLQEGSITLNGRTPGQWGVPQWRARVTYLPQSRVTLKGTPSELYFSAQQLSAQRRRSRGDLPALVHELGLEQAVLNQPWAELSGGQAQRVVLAICLALKPSILLLDEPTASLDTQSALQVERVLRACGAALVWVTHDDAQPSRVGGRVLQLPLGTEMAIEQALAGPRTLSITPDQEAEPEPLSEADLSPSPSPSPSQFLSPAKMTDMMLTSAQEVGRDMDWMKAALNAGWIPKPDQHLMQQRPGVPDHSESIDLDLIKNVLPALALVLIAIGVSVYLSLGLHKPLAIAAARCILQLTLLGYFLIFILGNQWWLKTTLYGLFMLAVAAAEAISRPSVAYNGMFTQVLGALGCSSALVITYSMFVVIRPPQRWDAYYVIPTYGMLLGNAISCTSIGLSTALQELTVGKDRVELMLALGASRLEATRGLLQDAVATALTPVLNQMAVIGLVSIPGMMTGQILGGSTPEKAARYQMAIMFMITATASVGTVAAVLGAVLTAVDVEHRLRGERLLPRSSPHKGVAHWVQAQVLKGSARASTGVKRLLVRIRLARGQGGAHSRRGGGGGWMVRSPLARRVFGQRSSRPDGRDDQPGGPLHDIIIGSDDEMESVLSGPMSDHGDTGQESATLLNESRWSSFGNR